MKNDLLENARLRAENAAPGVRAAALLRIARASATGDLSRARNLLSEGLDATATLSSPERDHLFDEARQVAAAIDPDLLAQIPAGNARGRRPFASGQVVQVMLAFGHVDAAFRYLLQQDDPSSFPFPWLGNVLNELENDTSGGADRRLILLRRAVEIWQRGSSGPYHHERSHFVRIFGVYWRAFPNEEALAIARLIVDRTQEEPDTGTSAGYMNGVHFDSLRQDTLFQIFHIVRHLDPPFAETLLASPDPLPATLRRYPNGLETMNEEAEAEAERRQAEGATCEGGYILMGDPNDFDRQRRLVDAARGGDFEPSIQDALEQYLEDTSSATPNYAPKAYWPSTGAFRTLFYGAGKRLGSDAEKLLPQVPDDDLHLFATIELAAALEGVPACPICQIRQPNPPGRPRPNPGRILSFRKQRGLVPDRDLIHSPDGRAIRCPKCSFRPSADLRWACKCGHTWNTFWTSGNCPACHFQWETTQCPACAEMSEHRSWYVTEQ